MNKMMIAEIDELTNRIPTYALLGEVDLVITGPSVG